MKVPVSTLSDPFLELPPPLPAPDVHALHDNIPVANEGLTSVIPPLPLSTPCLDLQARLQANQQSNFLHLWDGLPQHLRDIFCDLHRPGWSPSAIDGLGDALREY